jgi:hypothetical protein
MRYPKDSTVMTHSDLALLKHVRNARFVGHQQLFELLRHDSETFSRSSFNWRIQRLIQSNHIECVPRRWWNSGAVYSIAREGLLELESRGEFLIALNSSTRRTSNPLNVFHALELNAVRLALADHGLLADWQSDLEISSTNMVGGPFGKDYDALVKVWYRGQQIEFALEYERTLKSAKEFDKIRCALESEREIRCILYLAAHPSLLSALLQRLAPTNHRIGLTTCVLFREQMLSASVTLAGENRLMTFAEFLL